VSDAAAGPAPRSKTLATWIALLGGTLGLHRFYLRGIRDLPGWLYVAPTLLGGIGVQRMRQIGMDDRLAWMLTPLLGLSVTAAMASAIVYGLTPDDAWNRRFNRAAAGPPGGWAAVIGVVIALALGTTALMATIAFSAQRVFESLVEAPPPDGPAAN
jgi:hypothetical protein